MAAKDDHMYYETLTELVFDDKKVVTYKGLSALLGVHVNMAKQMLYTFYTQEKGKGKNVHALMFVSGIAGPKQSEETTGSSGSIPETMEKHCIVLCHDTDLLKTKSTYKKLYSVHIYSVSAFPVTDYSILQQKNAVVNPIEEANPATYGPFKVHVPAKEVMKPSSITTLQPVKIEPKSVPAKTEKSENKGKGNNEKKQNMFAAFKSNATKPTHVNKIQEKDFKPRISPEKGMKVEKQVQENGKSKKSDTKAKSSKRTNGYSKTDTTRKRSRIIMQSDSDSDEDDQPANKRSVFESSDEEAPVAPLDLDDSDEEEAPKTNGATKIEPMEHEPASKGKRKVAKIISHTYMDDEGFVVTRKEQVMVSEDDDDSPSSKTTGGSEIKKENIEKSPKAATNGNAKQTKTNDIVAKKKQSNIMSFFTKKN